MLKVILNFYERTGEAMNKGIALNKILKLPIKAEIGRMKELREVDAVRNLMGEIDKKIAAVEVDR